MECDRFLIHTYHWLSRIIGAFVNLQNVSILPMHSGVSSAIDRDRGKPHGSAPPTPPDMRVRIRRFGEVSNRVHS
jgi:hypothetical protein